MTSSEIRVKPFFQNNDENHSTWTLLWFLLDFDKKTWPTQKPKPRLAYAIREVPNGLGQEVREPGMWDATWVTAGKHKPCHAMFTMDIMWVKRGKMFTIPHFFVREWYERPSPLE